MSYINRDFNKKLLEEQEQRKKEIADRLIEEQIDATFFGSEVVDRRIYYVNSGKEIIQDDPFEPEIKLTK